MLRRTAVVLTTLITLGSGVLLAQPASADRPPAESGDCGFSFSDSEPSPGTVRFTVTMKCTALVGRIYHGITEQRSGAVVGIDRTTCVNSNHTTTFTCKATDTIANPSGSQKFEVLDEFIVYGGIDGTTLFDGKRIWSFYS